MALRNASLRNALPPVIAVMVLIAALVIYNAHRSPTVFCYGGPSRHSQGLTPSSPPPATTSPRNAQSAPTTLPPSRDNDAGISRQRDATPDADVDTYQKPRFCIKNGHHVVAP